MRSHRIFTFLVILSAALSVAAQKQSPTPAAAKLPSLPQSPVAPRVGNDLTDSGLKGNVKYLLSESGPITPGSKIRVKNTETFYNKIGNITRRVNYATEDPPGTFKKPSYILRTEVFGYLDGHRVSISDRIWAYLEDKKADKRYETRYVYEYDENGKVKQETRFDSLGQKTDSFVFTKDGDRSETIWIQPLHNTKLIATTFENGRIVKVSYGKTGMLADRIETELVVEERDGHGNWTRIRQTLKMFDEHGKLVENATYFDHHTITYY